MKQAILIDLDSLLDTRITTVSSINQNAAVALMNDRAYYTRTTNDFSRTCRITLAVFNEHFAKRNVDTLKRSLPTACILALRTMMTDLSDQKGKTPFADDVKLTVNCYPYVLHKEEQEAMADIIGAYSGIGASRVEMVYLSWAQLTPEIIRSRYTGVMLYNFSEWMEIQAEAFMSCRFPDIIVLAPALYKDREPTQEEASIEGGEFLSPFEITEGMLVGCFDLNFLDMRYFSLIPAHELHAAVQPLPVRPPAA